MNKRKVRPSLTPPPLPCSLLPAPTAPGAPIPSPRSPRPPPAGATMVSLLPRGFGFSATRSTVVTSGCWCSGPGGELPGAGDGSVCPTPAPFPLPVFRSTGWSWGLPCLIGPKPASLSVAGCGDTPVPPDDAFILYTPSAVPATSFSVSRDGSRRITLGDCFGP